MLFRKHLLVLSHSVMSDSVTPWTRACQAPLSMEFSRQEDWSKLLVSTPGDSPDPGIEPTSLAYPVLASMGRTVIQNSEDVIIDRIF